jgi:hypothetical protein
MLEFPAADPELVLGKALRVGTMNYRMLLPLTALTLSCSFVTGPGSSSSSAVPLDLDSPADPVNVVVELNEDETTSSVVSPEGGELALMGADGSVFTLEVPPGALLADTEISMTAIGSLEGGPVESNVYGVQLEPSGLAFYEFLTLTIQPAAEIPLEEQFMFKYEGSGSDFHRALIDPDSSEVRILLSGFSGGGVGRVTTADVAQWRMDRAQSAAARLENAIGEQQALERAGKITREQAQESIDKLLDDLDQAVVQAEKVATEDCGQLGKAIELSQTRNQLVEFGSVERLSSFAEPRALDRCRTYQAQGVWGPSSLAGVIKVQAPFKLTATSNYCTGTVDFLGSGMSGPVKCNATCSGEGRTVQFTGSGKFDISLTESGGTIKGFCSSLGIGVRGDQAEEDRFFVTLSRVTK